MIPRIIALALFATSLFTFARDKQENWIQVNSPNFVVATNGSEKQGRHVADQLERMRSVFHAAFPKLKMDSDTPIIVIAVKGEKDFRALEPESYLAKGSLKLGGLFLRTADKNYILMRLDAEGEHPYSVIYHEYTHFLTAKGGESMPLWLNEGLAEFYENTEIHEKDASLGEASAPDLNWLREHRLLPLNVLFAVDHSSPYYHEEKKGSIFYAESWALTHFIQMTDFPQKAHRLSDYAALVAQNTDPVTAAASTFGDLKLLQSQLESYVRQGVFHYLKMPTHTEVDDSAFKVQALTPIESEAVCADFLAYEERTADSQAILDRILQDDPKNVSAHETKGYLAFRGGHIDEARKFYREAVELDSKSFLAHYYFAAMSLHDNAAPSETDQVETSLRASIKLNPHFAPAFDLLGVLLGMQNKNLDEARMMALTAISLEPSNVAFRLNMAHILLTMQRSDSAIQVLRAASKIAKTSEDSQMITNALVRAQEYDNAKKQFETQRVAQGQVTDSETVSAKTDIPKLKRRDFVPKGPHRFATGTLKSITCDNPGLDLTLVVSGKPLPLHADNYFKIGFSTLGFQPTGDLNPCTDLESRPAKVEYVESDNPAVSAQLVSVELHK